MAKPQHRTPEHRRAYRAIVLAQRAGQTLWCHESECVMPTRYIYPDQRAAVLHDTTGTVVLGPGHAKCNSREGAIRGNLMRAGRATRRLNL